MKNNLVEFDKMVRDLEAQISSRYKKYETQERELMLDGAINLKDYYEANIKIMWVLKEPYDDGEGTGGGWSLTEKIGKAPEDFVFGIPRATWQPIVYVSYAIQNNMPYDAMDYIRDNRSMISVLRKISVINVQKMPANTRTRNADIDRAFEENKDILLNQIKIFNPDIIIGANTLHLFKSDLSLNQMISFETESNRYWIHDSKLYIAAYHPAQTQVTRETYVDNILDAFNNYQTCQCI